MVIGLSYCHDGFRLKSGGGWKEEGRGRWGRGSSNEQLFELTMTFDELYFGEQIQMQLSTMNR